MAVDARGRGGGTAAGGSEALSSHRGACRETGSLNTGLCPGLSRAAPQDPPAAGLGLRWLRSVLRPRALTQTTWVDTCVQALTCVGIRRCIPRCLQPQRQEPVRVQRLLPPLVPGTVLRSAQWRRRTLITETPCPGRWEHTGQKRFAAQARACDRALPGGVSAGAGLTGGLSPGRLQQRCGTDPSSGNALDTRRRDRVVCPVRRWTVSRLLQPLSLTLPRNVTPLGLGAAVASRACRVPGDPAQSVKHRCS